MVAAVSVRVWTQPVLIKLIHHTGVSFDVFYQFLNKRNQLGDMETLDQQKLGLSFSYTNAEKISINGEFNYIDNDFTVVSLADPTVVQYRPSGRFINEYRYYKEQRKRYVEVSLNGVDLNVYFETQIGDVWRKSESPVVYKKVEPNVYRSVSGGTIVVTSDHQLIDKDMYGSSEYDKVYTKME